MPTLSPDDYLKATIADGLQYACCGKSADMRALTVQVSKPDSLQVEDVPEPDPGPDELLVNGVAIGLCGTDKEIAGGEYGWAPPGRDRLVLGHESLGRVERAPSGSGFDAGDLVVGVVRRPDPEPCGACAHGEFDMCRNGRYTERGIKELDGYGSQRWCVESDYAVRLDPHLADVGMLMEPTTVVAKAWEQVRLVGERAWFEPNRALITGAGPIGLLAALLSVQQGLETHVLDRVTDGPKPGLVRALGATYHHADINEVAGKLQPDVVIEATGAGPLVFGALANTGGYGIVCLTGVSPSGRTMKVDAGAVNRELVLENDAVVGSVNANLRHYHQAAEALAKADASWLAGLITRRVPLHRAADAFAPQDDDVKVVVDLEQVS
jgi:threonine dehydrogenase-like Zn-dependent dehydrogenase